MAWVKIDDQFADHPKIKAVGCVGQAIQIAALCYCNRYLTDGFLSFSSADSIVRATLAPITGASPTNSDTISDSETSLMKPGAIYTVSLNCGMQGLDAEDIDWTATMCNAGLWELVEGGFQVHDYLDYNPSKQDVLTRKQTSAKGGISKWNKTKTNSDTISDTNGETNSDTISKPVPDPLPKSKKKNTEDSVPKSTAESEIWNQMASKHPNVEPVDQMTDKRRDKLRIRQKEPAFDFPAICEAVGKLCESKRFPTQKGFTPTFNWIIDSESNYISILEQAKHLLSNGLQRFTSSSPPSPDSIDWTKPIELNGKLLTDYQKDLYKGELHGNS